jgi:hypothetical protein
MEHKIREFINIEEKIEKLNLNTPTELVFLPYNFESSNTPEDFLYDNSIKVVKKLWKQESIEVGRLEKDTSKTKYYQENDITWIGPTIFVAYSFWTENSNLIAIGLSVIANYLTDFFKGKTKKPNVRIEYVLEQNPRKGKKNVKFSYDGDIEGLSKIPEILAKLKDE